VSLIPLGGCKLDSRIREDDKERKYLEKKSIHLSIFEGVSLKYRNFLTHGFHKEFLLLLS